MFQNVHNAHDVKKDRHEGYFDIVDIFLHIIISLL